MNLALTVELTFGLSLLAVCLWEARKARRRAQALHREFATLQLTVQEFMKETEATFSALSRSIQRVERPRASVTASASHNRILLGGTPILKTPVEAKATKAASATLKRMSGEKKAQVLALAGKGIPAADIASQLTIPQGEINLILNLVGRAASH